MERALATIRTIDKMLPHTNADKLEIAMIGGWQVVTGKDQFKEGDYVIFCEIDSWIPTKIAPFLTKPGHYPKVFNGIEGERLKTIKLRGELSQGLILPVPQDLMEDGSISPGDDITEWLGITKWEPPIAAHLAGTVKGNFPHFLHKTDQERIQNLTRDFEQWCTEEMPWEVTEKLDGSSMTVYIKDGEFGVCSRNLELKDEGNNTYWNLAKQLELMEKLQKTGRNLALQGELIGAGVQKNPYGLEGQEFHIYDIFDIDKQEYLGPNERLMLANDLELDHVPVLDNMRVLAPEMTVGLILAAAEGKTQVVWKSTAEREGLVFKRCDGRRSFKAISNKFLLKQEAA